MKKTPTYLKAIAMVAMLLGIIGFAIAIKIPGNIAYAPLFFAFLFGISASVLAKKQKVKCYGGYIAVCIAAIGLIISLFMQSKESKIATDKDQIETLEESNNEVLDGGDIDDALNDLE